MGVKISFIIPTYNPSEEKDYFSECLSSIEKVFQKGDEILVIDDGSTNRSYIKNICNQYNNITIKRINKNSGISHARNIGIKICKNNYYTIVDSDDLFFDTEAFKNIRSQVNSRDKIDMYAFGAASISNGELTYNMSINNPKDTEDLLLNILFTPFADYRPKLYSAVSSWGKIYRKTFTIRNNLTYEEIPHRAEDCVFFLDYLAANPKIKVIEEYAYFYRTNEDSVTHQYNPDMYKMISNTVKSLEKRIDLNNPKECEAMLYRKVSYIATAMNNVFHINNKSNLYSKYKASRNILWSDDNLDALQSVDFSRYSFGKSGTLLKLLRHNMILIPSILMEARRRAIIAKRFTMALIRKARLAISTIKTKHVFTSYRTSKGTPQINRQLSIE